MDEYKKKLLQGSFPPNKSSAPESKTESNSQEIKKDESESSSTQPKMIGESGGPWNDRLLDFKQELESEFEIKIKLYKEELKESNRRFFKIAAVVLGLMFGILGAVLWRIAVRQPVVKTHVVVDPQAGPLLEVLKKSVEETKSQSSEAVKQVNDLSAFTLKITQAKNDDRFAFEEILKIGNDDHHAYQSIAQQAVAEIFGAVSQAEAGGPKADILYPWGKESYKDIPFEKFIEIYVQASSLYRPGLLMNLWNHPKFTEPQKLGFLMEVIKSDRSLRALARACQLADQKAHLNRPFTAYAAYLEWWAQNRK